MHELSVANALIDLVDSYAPEGSTVRSVEVRAGAMQAIVPEAMQWAWQAAREGTRCQAATLELETLDWLLRCLDCDREFDSPDIDTTCTCGGRMLVPIGSDELTLMSLEIDDPDDTVPEHPDRQEALT